MAADPEGSGERILIVEDDVDYRSYLEGRLQRDGHTTAAMPDAESALLCLEDFRPTILITDLMMPGMDGRALCREVRGRAGWTHLPILVLSGAEDSASIADIVGLGLVWYLRKGATWDHLEKTLANLMVRAHEVPDGPAEAEQPSSGHDVLNGP